jgi:hypothetical protein
VGFEFSISAFERVRELSALDREATVIRSAFLLLRNWKKKNISEMRQPCRAARKQLTELWVTTRSKFDLRTDRCRT